MDDKPTMSFLSSPKQQPLLIALVVIFIFIGGVLYRYFQQAPEAAAPGPFSSPKPIVPVPQFPQDLFENNAFLQLQTYQPVVAPEPSARPNPFAAP